MGITYDDGMDLTLWVWDSGVVEGFAVYLNGQKAHEETLPFVRFPIAPTETLLVEVKFAGVDGGSTKITDGKTVVAFIDSAVSHSYTIDVKQ